MQHHTKSSFLKAFPIDYDYYLIDLNLINISYDDFKHILKLLADEPLVEKLIVGHSYSVKFSPSLKEKLLNNDIEAENEIYIMYISAIFVAYYKAQESFEARAFRERQNNEWVAQQLKERFGVEKAPWDWINEQLEKYEFKHKVKPAMDGSYELAFEGSTVKYEQLSSGEKVIFHSVLSTMCKANKILFKQ